VGCIEFGTKRQLNQESPYRVSYEDYPDRILHALQLRGYEAENRHSTWNVWDDAEESIGGVFINMGSGHEVLGLCLTLDIAKKVADALRLIHPGWDPKAEEIKAPS
jgi:hypothetical protein